MTILSLLFSRLLLRRASGERGQRCIIRYGGYTIQTTVLYFFNALTCASHLPPFQEAISFHSLLFSPKIDLKKFRKQNNTKSLHEIVSPRTYGPFLSVDTKYECALVNAFSNFPHASVRALPVGTTFRDERRRSLTHLRIHTGKSTFSTQPKTISLHLN